MSEPIPLALLNELSDVISRRMGLHFASERSGDLLRGLRSATQEFGFDDPAACAAWLCSTRLTQQQVEILASHLTVGETYFFREQRSFQLLEEQILPQIIASRTGQEQRLRIWSAGCCTGEEPYSLAIVLSRLIRNLENWDITLLATDINPRFLKKASAGVYGEWSFRDAASDIKRQCFERAPDGRYELLASIRKLVTFDYLNLAEDTFPSLLNNTNAMDLILCRNVLIYLSPEQIERLVEKFRRCLCETGWLLVGATETSLVNSDDLRVVNLSGLIAYQKCTGATASRFQSTPTAAPSDLLPLDFTAPVAVHVPPRPPPATNPRPPEPPAAPEALFERGSYAQAAERLAQRLAKVPPASSDLALMARACANQGDLKVALQWSQRAVDADKMNPSFHYLRATILQEMEDLPEAAAAFRRALYLEPNFIMAHFAFAHLARRQGRPGNASRHFGIALELLRGHPADQSLPDSEGMTAGRLAQIIATVADKDFAS